MRIYNYDANGYYTGASYNFVGKILPKFTTKTPPPPTIKGKTIAKYNTEKDTWKIVDVPSCDNTSNNTTTIKEVSETPKSTENVEIKEPIKNDNITHSNLLLENKKLKKEIVSKDEELSSIKETSEKYYNELSQIKGENTILRNRVKQVEEELLLMKKKLAFRF